MAHLELLLLMVPQIQDNSMQRLPEAVTGFFLSATLDSIPVGQNCEPKHVENNTVYLKIILSFNVYNM